MIELCDSDTQIKLALGDCDPCAISATHLLIQRAGCPEYEEVCVEKVCESHSFGCGCRSCCTPTVECKQVEKKKPAVVYPLLEIDANGDSVFALDSKLKTLGYGRYHATVLVNDHPTQVAFDIDYIAGAMTLGAISTSKALPNMEVC